MSMFTPVTGTESENLRAWIVNGLANLRSTVHGLSFEQVCSRPVSSSELTLAWLLLHVSSVAEQWSTRAAAGEAGPEEDRLPVAELFALGDAATTLPGGADLDWLLGEYDARVSRAGAALEHVDLDARCPVPDWPWYPADLRDVTGRWCLLHTHEEIERHSGHADLLREAIDGRTMYELIAEDQGESLDHIGEWFAAHPEVPSPW